MTSEEENAPKPAVSTEEESDDLIFETLWGRVLEAWDDDKTHGALLEYVVRAQMLADAAGRYRALENDPEKGAVAKKKLNGIVVAATQMMLSMKTPPPTKIPPAMTWSVAACCAIVIAWMAYAMIKH